MNFKTTFTLLMLLLALGCYFVFIESKKQTTTQREQIKAQNAAEKGSPLFASDGLGPNDVTSFTLTRPELPPAGTIEITKEGSEWFQTKPVRFALNNYSASSMVSEAIVLRYSEKLKPGDKDVPKFDDIGLGNKDVITLTLAAGNGKKSHILRIGKKTIGGFGYVMIDSDPAIYIVNDALHRQLSDNKLNDWRKKSLFAPTEGQARRVTLVHGTNNIEMVNVESNWSFVSPNSGRVSSATVGTLLSNLKSTYLTKFIADAPKDLAIYGLDKPTLELTIEVPPAVSGEKQPEKNTTKPAEKPIIYTLRVGAPADLKTADYFATFNDGTGTDGVVFTLVRSEVERLSKSVNDLRDPRVTPLTALDVREITITKPLSKTGLEPGSIKLVHESKGWSFADPKPNFKADSGIISDLIEGIVEAKAATYQQDRKSTDESLVTISLTAVGRSEPEVLRIVALDGNKTEAGRKKFVIHRNNETTGYVVEAEANSKFGKIFEPVLALRDRNVLELSNERINALMIKREGPHAATYTFARTVPTLAEIAKSDDKKKDDKKTALPGPWLLAGAAKFEQTALSKLFAELTPIHAEKWVVVSDAKSTGKDAISITLTTAEGVTTTLTIEPTSRVTTVTGIDQSFIAEQSLVDAVSAEFADRTVLSLSLDEIKSVDVDGVILSRDDDGKYLAASSEQKLNQAAAGALFDALAGLRVERYMTTSVPGDKSQHNLQITTKTGQNYKLQLSAATNTLVIGDRVALLDDATKKKLTADLFAKEAPAAPPSGFNPNMGNFGGMQD